MKLLKRSDNLLLVKINYSPSLILFVVFAHALAGAWALLLPLHGQLGWLLTGIVGLSLWRSLDRCLGLRPPGRIRQLRLKPDGTGTLQFSGADRLVPVRLGDWSCLPGLVVLWLVAPEGRAWLAWCPLDGLGREAFTRLRAHLYLYSSPV
jgi:hypothetical protein